VRLGACVALETVIGAVALTVAGAGAYFGFQAASIEPVAAASITAPAPKPQPEPEPEPEPDSESAPEPTPGPVETVFPASDDELLAPLRDAPIAAVKLNRGGSSLSLRVDFASGGRAAFKPEQIHPQSNPRREIAAYRVDRLLGIGRVPPAIARSFPTGDVIEGFDPRTRAHGRGRIADEGRQRAGRLAGELSWWIPEIHDAKVGGHLLDTLDAILIWKPWLQIGRPIPDAARAMAEQISTLTVFDFLIDNKDRWSGANIKVAPGGDELFFMDNTMSFSRDTDGHRKSKVYLARVQKFSRRLIDRIRAIGEADRRAAVENDLGPFDDGLLDDEQIAGFMGRRAAVLAHVDRLIAKHGEDAVLAFP
jgi:hypothetical protein